MKKILKKLHNLYYHTYKFHYMFKLEDFEAVSAGGRGHGGVVYKCKCGEMLI